MRQIKFRGRCGSVSWHYGYLTQDTYVVSDNEHRTVSYIVKGGAISRTADGRLFDCEVVDTATVGQFTGLTDMNRKEIYEGDIVELRQPDGNCVPCEVCFCEKGFWAISSGIYERVMLGYISRDHIKVIRNIYDNPELLED